MPVLATGHMEGSSPPLRETLSVMSGPNSARRYVEPLLESIQHLKRELTQSDNLPHETRPTPLSVGLELSCINEKAPTDPNDGLVESNATAQTPKRYAFGVVVASYARRAMYNRVVRPTNHFDYLKSFCSGAELPFPLTFRPGATRSTRPRFRETFIRSSLVPGDVTKRLLDFYVDQILPQCPVFAPKEVYQIYYATYGRISEAAPATKADLFIISMIMAIATMVSKVEDYRRALDLGEAFRKEAMEADGDGQLFATTNIPCLQSLLLLVQYGLFVPHAVSVWHTVSEAMRLSIELGLHREPPEASNIGEENMRARRRLFWAVG